MSASIESESIEIGPPDIFGQAYAAFLRTDAGFYRLQDESEDSLSLPWFKSTPGSDERLLAIEDDDEFRWRLRANRAYEDSLALMRERSRRKREAFELMRERRLPPDA